MKILTVFVLASLALPAFAANKTCALSSAAQKKHLSGVLSDEISFRGSKDLVTSYDAKTQTLQLGHVDGSCPGGALECNSYEVTQSFEEIVSYAVNGTQDCSTKFVALSASEDRGADGEISNSDQEIQEALNIFKNNSQQVCDALNATGAGQSQLEIKNDSTTSGFFFGTGERVHLEFNARCIIQD